MTVREHRPLAADAVAAGRLGLPWTVSAASPSHVRGNVLVVEDEPTIADVVSRYLRRDVRHVFAATERAASVLGFAAATTLEDGMRAFAAAPLR
jgi:hypothetical protein